MIVIYSNESLYFVVVLGKVPQARTNCAPGGVNAGNNLQTDISNLDIPINFLAIDFGIGNHGEHVIFGRCQTILQQAIDVLGHLDHDFHANAIVFGG